MATVTISSSNVNVKESKRTRMHNIDLDNLSIEELEAVRQQRAVSRKQYLKDANSEANKCNKHEIANREIPAGEARDFFAWWFSPVDFTSDSSGRRVKDNSEVILGYLTSKVVRSKSLQMIVERIGGLPALLSDVMMAMLQRGYLERCEVDRKDEDGVRKHMCWRANCILSHIQESHTLKTRVVSSEHSLGMDFDTSDIGDQSSSYIPNILEEAAFNYDSLEMDIDRAREERTPEGASERVRINREERRQLDRLRLSVTRARELLEVMNTPW